MTNDFLVFGASGLTGGYFLKEIKDRGKEFHLFNRELMENESKENQTLYTSENIPKFPEAKTLAICIGYPLDFLELIFMPNEKKQIFTSVDLDLVVEVAKKAYKNNIQNILIISAVGANKSSPNFYLKTKGVMEEEIRKIGFNTIIFARPGHLLGPRDNSRVDVFVRLIEFFGNIFSFMYVGPLRKYKNIRAKTVANVLLRSLEQEQSISEIISYERV
jgi:uncharacterized protein YbjT (DUF2867 family)|tara:strand:- start:1686 stop:2339 length:654 start_codon:yes stop_codon:yes gene_type:complete